MGVRGFLLTMQVHWHRRDLRMADNPVMAIEDGPLVGLVVLDPDIESYAGPPRQAFFSEAVRSLRAEYRNSGGELYVRRGDPGVLVPAMANACDATAVSWEIDYSGLATRRDRRVQARLNEAGIDVVSDHGALLHPPGSITTNDGEPYQTFTYFGRKWMDREKPGPASTPTSVRSIEVESGEIPDQSCSASIPTAGTEEARGRLSRFCDGPIFEYDDTRDRPAARGTSRLSADLSFGTVGIRTVWSDTQEAKADAECDNARSSVEEFQRQLAWREFYSAMLAAHPSMLNTNLTSFERPIEWRTDSDELEAWKAGDTGFPIVDAGMRQLNREAYMHNRVRMIVASFLTKDLQIDWRVGYRYFRRRLVDHDPGNDAGGWQWASSTGTDAQPYFRIFNPMTQGERHDPEATYIKRYVDELGDAPVGAIHAWPSLSGEKRDEVAPAYPDPVVDHQERREDALEMFRRARGDTNAS